MKKTRNRVVALALFGALAFSGIGVGVASAATTSSSCVLLASTPYRSGSNVVAKGGRTGCTNTVAWVRVELKHQQRYAPDTVVAQNTYTNVKTVEGIRAQTTGRSWALYFTKTISSTGSTLSSALFDF